ncbi:rhodanese-like domain-containing protein [Heyndrickxia acidicola]|uniref:Rhodanese-like domain-containing protein n=1 Tax=Heyndrickxia acidicola TaxID=209389 RepID=A0ABU6MER5_9BACI|nr:rhodanese-like domain-containing protein [Heyndrickxia acidicola]MED1203131.1 rhodanese-like domain-containing protein [Heyndrickxia acidicola]
MLTFQVISTEELKNKLAKGEKLNLIDVREEDEVAEGMIPEAKHIPMGEIPASLDQFNKDEEYIFICRSSGRSGRVCEYMSSQGFKVTNMTGGMLEWTGETKPKK